ncbi:DNA-binding protein [Paraburkholderia hayleyella]|uniref:DNA-binding protein n=1 Tax=Paraburkholderia hayleyella TaxID=2152889 RepID=UPI00158112D8|nr:DNA-binding protein [Paraburkholderia hayleyella]
MTLEAEIQTLRERITDTQTLYREVCALMFFRYGETPTANKLYQLVRKGSMSAPAKALKDFWADMRDKTRIDVGQPDLPSEVATAAGELAATLWRMSSETAAEGLAAFRQDAQQEVEIARKAALEATQQRQAAEASAIQAAQATADAQRRLAELNAHRVEQQTENTMLREQLIEAKQETSAAAAALAEARRDFAGELEKLRQSLSQNEQRLAAAERRALLEIESERAKTQRTQAEMARRETAHQAERDQLQDDLARIQSLLHMAKAHGASLENRLALETAALAGQQAQADLLRRQLDKFTDELARRSALKMPKVMRRRVPQVRVKGG